MELKDRLNVLIQSAQIAQKSGVLSLDDAVVVKYAISSIEKGENLKSSVGVLSKVASQAQSKGVYSLKDAYLIYIALNDIENLLPVDERVNTETQVEETPTEQEEPKLTKKKKEK